MSGVYRLALVGLRFRLASSLATFVAVLLGGSLLVACGGLFETAIRLAAPPQRLAGVPIVVGGPGGFALPDQDSQTVPYTERTSVPADAVERIAAIPGVQAAVADVSFPAVLVRNGQAMTGGGTVSSGHGWASAALTPYHLSAGRQPASTGQVVLDESSARAVGTGPGKQVEVVVNGKQATFAVTGVATAGAANVPALFFSAADTSRFARQRGNTVDVVGVQPAPGTDVDALVARLRDTLGSAVTVRTGDDRGRAEFVDVDSGRLPLILLAAIFGGMVIVVMALVVSATISLAIRQRLRELALLRATAATPRQVHRMVVVETAMVAALATTAGLALGGVVGRLIFAAGLDRGVVPAALEYRQGILPFAAGAMICLVVTVVAAGLAARPAGRVKPIQALAAAAIPPVRVSQLRRLAAAVFAAGTVALATTTLFMGPEAATATGGPAVLTGAIAVALVAPELLARVIAVLMLRLGRTARPSTTLALLNVRGRAVSYAAVLTPLTLATAIALGNVYSMTTVGATAARGFTDQFTADAVITSTAGGIAPDLVAAVRQTPGVASVSALVESRGWIEQPYDGKGSDPMRLLGVDAEGQDPILTTKVAAGSLRELTGDTVAVPRGQAERLSIALGDTITMRLGDGAAVRARVVALMDGSAKYPSLVLPADLLAPHTTDGLSARVLLRAADGEDASDVAAAVRDQAKSWPGVTVGDHDELSKVFAAGLNVEAWINYLLAVLAIAYAVIAAVNALAVALLGRQAEFGAHRLAGATRSQIRRMLYVEAGLVAAVALALGTVIALFTIWPTAVAVGSAIPSGPAWFLPAIVTVVLATVWPVTALVSRLALNPRPFDAISAPGQ
jgi:putative ABC transport system permease protein